MLKILFNTKKAQRHPFEIFFLGLIYSSISILFSLWVFSDYASIAFVFLTVFSCLYLIQASIRKEEEKDSKIKKETKILKEHSKLISLMLFLFLGFTVSFTLWSFFLPAEKTVEIFAFQDSAILGVKNAVASGAFGSFDSFFPILLNNIKVLLVSLIFAIFYGAGAMYILVWNASVMGLVIGNLAKSTLGIVSLPIAFSKYFLHGIPEMIAYFITALAGGIIFVAIIKNDFKEKEKRKKISRDVLTLILLAIIILILAGLIEVFISPYI